MAGKAKYVNKQLKWPEKLLAWKTIRAEALKKNLNVGDYIAQAVEQRIKQGW